MSTRVSLNPATEVVLASAVSSIALPTAATDGRAIDVAPTSAGPAAGVWKQNNQGQADGAVFWESSAAVTLTAPIALFGYRTDTAKWYNLGPLNGGQAIATQGASVGGMTVVQFASVFNRLALGPLTGTSAVNVTGGTFTARATQIRQVGAV